MGHYPGLLFFWRYLFRAKANYSLVSEETDIVIEGFPRSGNTFAVAAFSFAQVSHVHIAGHTHRAAHVITAVKSHIPTVVIIRNPRDTALSCVIRSPFLSLEQALKGYIRFYQRLMPYKYGVVFARFEEVVSNFGTVIEEVNEKFGTVFKIFEHTDANVAQCFQQIEKLHRNSTGDGSIFETAIARPSIEREKLKSQLQTELQNEQLQAVLKQAEDIYENIVGLCSAKSKPVT